MKQSALVLFGGGALGGAHLGVLEKLTSVGVSQNFFLDYAVD